jgi:integrase/recombinase XerD
MKLAMGSSEFLADRSRRGCNAATCAFYAKLLRWLCEFLEGRGVSDVEAVTTRLLEDYVADLRTRPISGVTVRKRVLSIKTFWIWCAGRGYVPEDPARLLPTPKKSQKLPKALSEGQARQLLATPMPIRDRAVISLMLDTGIRVGECSALDLSDLDDEQMTLLVRTGKGDKQRVIVFAEATREALRAWLRERQTLLRPPYDEKALFVTSWNSGKTKSGARASRIALYKAVKRVADDAGLYAVVSPHRLRHSCATMSLDNGAELPYVSKQLGHSDIATTMIYLHIANKKLSAKHAGFSPMKALTRK